MSIYQKIEELKNEYSSEADLAIINGWERELMELAPKIEMAKVKPIKELLESLVTKVRSAKAQLTENNTLSELERSNLFAEVKVYNEILNYFLSAKNYAEYLVNNIQEANTKKL